MTLLRILRVELSSYARPSVCCDPSSCCFDEIRRNLVHSTHNDKQETIFREQLKEELLRYDSTLDASKVGYHLTTMSSQMGMTKNDFLRQVVAYEYPNYAWEKASFSLREEYKELVTDLLAEIGS